MHQQAKPARPSRVSGFWDTGVASMWPNGQVCLSCCGTHSTEHLEKKYFFAQISLHLPAVALENRTRIQFALGQDGTEQGMKEYP